MSNSSTTKELGDCIISQCEKVKGDHTHEGDSLLLNILSYSLLQHFIKDVLCCI